LPVAFLFGQLSFGLLTVVAFIVGLLTVLNDIAYFAFIPHLVLKEALVGANSRLEGSRSTAGVAGPSVGGWLSQLIGPANALFVDASTYLFSIVQLHRLHGTSGGHGQRSADDRWYSGIKCVFQSPALRLLALSSGFFNLFSAGGFAVIGVFFVQQIGLSPGLYGLALGFAGLGGLVGAAVASRLADRPPRYVLAVSLLICGMTEVVLLLAQTANWVAFSVLALNAFVGTMAVVVFIVTNAALRQRLIPSELRGRTFAAMRLINRGLMPLGALMIGFVATWSSLRIAILVIGLGQLAVSATFVANSKVLAEESGGSR
jgi:predicted MFS family arabinose efflux permease